MSRDKIVLSFHETLLRESDVDILRGPRWLNDTLISFYFEYLERVRFKDYTSILFVSPEVTQCIKVVSSAEISIFLDPLYAGKKDFIFFALNDNERADCSGGSHWSLLVFSRPENVLFHFDSHAGSNYLQARDLGTKLLKYFQIPSQPSIIEPDTLQQTNGYDCGVHVLCNTELVAVYASLYKKINGCGMLDNLKVLHKRSELIELIYNLQ
ncbi:Deneddylase 1 [Carabus blaptoides fortunei]